MSTFARCAFYKPDAIHGERDLAVFHEPAPDVAGAGVFGAEEDDADVDADHVGIDPAGLGVEGVDEAVLAVDLFAVLVVHGLQSSGGEFGCEH